MRWGTAFTPVLSAAPLGLPLALSDPGGPAPSPRPGKLQATPRLSVPLSYRGSISEPGAFRCLSISSPWV